jgi:hypothetical protein
MTSVARAAELLLPRETFLWLLREDFTLEDVRRLAEHFHASVEATALRCVLLSPGPVGVAVLESVDGTLCVRWAAGNGLPDIPRRVPIGDASPIARGDDVDFRGETGLVSGVFNASARFWPYVRSGHRIERALVLLRP